MSRSVRTASARRAPPRPKRPSRPTNPHNPQPPPLAPPVVRRLPALSVGAVLEFPAALGLLASFGLLGGLALWSAALWLLGLVLFWPEGVVAWFPEFELCELDAPACRELWAMPLACSSMSAPLINNAWVIFKNVFAIISELLSRGPWTIDIRIAWQHCGMPRFSPRYQRT